MVRMPKFKLGEPPQWQAKKLILATKLTKQNDALILLLQEEKYLLSKANELTSANINQNAMIISTLKNIEIILKSKRC